MKSLGDRWAWREPTAVGIKGGYLLDWSQGSQASAESPLEASYFPCQRFRPRVASLSEFHSCCFEFSSAFIDSSVDYGVTSRRAGLVLCLVHECISLILLMVPGAE